MDSVTTAEHKPYVVNGVEMHLDYEKLKVVLKAIKKAIAESCEELLSNEEQESLDDILDKIQ